MQDNFIALIKQRFSPKVDLRISLGPCSLRLVSNVEDFVASKYFSSHSQKNYKNDKVDFQLYCISLEKSGIRKEQVVNFVDKTCRGGQFSDGYYATDHFGNPVYLISKETTYYLFGENLEKLVWPYFVKYFLLQHSVQNESLFLKAAAFSINSRATLLLGRGSSGKTVFLSGMCLNGAGFISNSHTIIKNNLVYGVASAMRVRPQPWSEGLFDKDKIHPGIKRGEIIVDPYDVFKPEIKQQIKVKNICILNFKGSRMHGIVKIPHKTAYNYAEQFSLGINVYRLEEDLLDLYKNDISLFSEKYALMKTQLTDLVRECNCYYISSDVLDPKYRKEIMSLLD